LGKVRAAGPKLLIDYQQWVKNTSQLPSRLSDQQTKQLLPRTNG